MKLVLLGAAFLTALGVYLFYTHKKVAQQGIPKIQSVDDIRQLFPTDKADLLERSQKAYAEAESRLEAIYSIDPEKRTFDNTMRAFDSAYGRFRIVLNVLEVLSLVSPDDEKRAAAQETFVKMQAFSIDHFGLNPRVYKSISQYVEHLKDPAFAASEALNPEQKYFVEETMLEFHRTGLQLPQETQEKIKALRKELSRHEVQFERNIANDQRVLEVAEEELVGLDEDFVRSLKKSASGKYILGTDMPTYNKVFEQCSNRSTREKYYRMFVQRIYPENDKELNAMIDLRDQLAHLLGYKSFAQLDIENQMAKTPEAVRKFIDEIATRAQIKCDQEMERLKKDLAPGVTLSPEGTFYTWDLTFVRNHYKKRHLAVNEAEIAKFFPVEHTFPALLSIYEEFFGLTFRKVDAEGFWHKDVQMRAVYKNGTYIGAVILDIYPRPFKFTHAAAATVVPGIRTQDGQWYPSVVVVVANFPPASLDQPALLQRRDVSTFFHEFGHALHALLGATELISFSGTAVKTDFVEMPSQMLEEWLWDPVILKRVSSHYETKEPLSDEVIEKIRLLKNFDSGEVTMRQLYLGSACLDFFMPGAHKDLGHIWHYNQDKYRTYLDPDKHNRSYCTFGHLAGYASKYYGYMWSLVYALDLFAYIKTQGLLNPKVGEKYAREVLGKGGAQDPMELLTHFLGRKPNSDAFFKDLGL